ncbi:MAG: hypothetical protein ACXVX8_04880 [Blastococcus sp.]
MTGLRRILALVTLSAAVILAGAAPAVATFSKSRALPSMTVSTGTVTAPSTVTALLASCSNARWMSVTVSWDASASRGVSGYTVRAYRSDGQVTIVAQTDATTTTADTTVDKLSIGSTSVTFAVTTLTSYGWTAESPRSGQMTC